MNSFKSLTFRPHKSLFTTKNRLRRRMGRPRLPESDNADVNKQREKERLKKKRQHKKRKQREKERLKEHRQHKKRKTG